MQPLIRYLPKEFNYDFIRYRYIPITLSAFLVVASLISVAVQGLTFGIDFAGGLKIDARAEQAVDVAELRDRLNSLGIGGVAITTAGAEKRDVIIRVQQQEDGEQALNAALKKVQAELNGFEIRSTESVGPKVGAELIINGALAIALSLIGIAIYVWLRFEWQFALGACLSLTHDVITTVGLFSLLQIEFDLNTVAAVLTIVGFSINDTVVVYDRVRELLRKYKKLPLPDLLNLSLNRVLSRTVVTSLTALLAVMALVVAGGAELRSFSTAMAWGLIVGTYSTIYVALPVLVYFELRRDDLMAPKDSGAVKGAAEQAG
ncbi:MAG: protein translocase subunit SecF [Rhodobacteraceae bacterium]|nr:protein translocase subunit SecF [Paracoccaceae bacterium]